MDEATATNSRLRAVVVAYACEPGGGSEEGAGWALVRAALGEADCAVVTLAGLDGPLQAWAAAHPKAGLRVVPVPGPRWGGLLGFHRIGRFIAYLAWLRRAARRARSLVVEVDADLAWHATLSAYWLPSPAVRLGVPSVWGPVGGAVTAPRRLRPLLGPAGRLSERLDAVAVRAMARLPAARRTSEQATVRLLQNAETAARVGLRPGRDRVLNHALLVTPPAPQPGDAAGPVVWVGALERRKGPLLAVRALAAAAPDVRLRMYGDGPERKRVVDLARRLEVAPRLELMGRVPRHELLAGLAGSSAALFTGLYEEGGLALAEVLAAGVPTVVLDHGGAGTIARRATDLARVARVPPGPVGVTAERLGAELTRLVAAPPSGRQPLLDHAAAAAELAAALRTAAG